MDLTVVAIPAYFGGMGAEYLWLKRTAAERGVTAGDYERRDTLASLSMGVGSLLAPVVMAKVLAPVTPGKGRYAKVAMGLALGAGVVTTVADVLARKGEGPLAPAGVLPPPEDPPSPPEGLASRAERRERAGSAGGVLGGHHGAGRRRGVGRHRLGPPDRRTAPLRQTPGRDLGAGPLAVAGAVLVWDFVYYWNHRLAHESRYLWAVHVVHHSSERYNLSTALRQPVSDSLTASLPYGALALLGFRPEVIETARGVNLLYQFWIHTEAIDSIGPAEQVFNSPSLHRVHHGSNQLYLDRNHGSILILWDRLFGTHQVEQEPVVYGLTRNIDSFDPVTIATHEWRDVIDDVRRGHHLARSPVLCLPGTGLGLHPTRRGRRGAAALVDGAPADQDPTLPVAPAHVEAPTAAGVA